MIKHLYWGGIKLSTELEQKVGTYDIANSNDNDGSFVVIKYSKRLTATRDHEIYGSYIKKFGVKGKTTPEQAIKAAQEYINEQIKKDAAKAADKAAKKGNKK